MGIDIGGLVNSERDVEGIVQNIMEKHQFWNEHKTATLSARQIKIIELLFGHFYGNLTTSKWAKINKCSQDTALRDIQDLVEKGILKKSKSGGRSTNYELIKSSPTTLKAK